jgi:glycosyltransferase involved in cell wall biosynthesis
MTDFVRAPEGPTSDRPTQLAEHRRAVRARALTAHARALEELEAASQGVIAADSAHDPWKLAARRLRLALDATGPSSWIRLKTWTRARLLEFGAADAAAPGVSPARRVLLLGRHLISRGRGFGPPLARRALEPVTRVLKLADGKPWPGPVLSLVVDATRADAGEIARFVSGWSCALPTEIVLWDSLLRRATLAGTSDSWSVGRDLRLAGTLHGKYAWVVPPTASRFPSTFLDLNLFALEGEQLDFTINAFAAPGQAEQAFDRARLPGRRRDDVSLIVGRAELLDDQLAWRLESTLPANGEVKVVGRFVCHPAEAAVPGPDSWPGEEALVADLVRAGPCLVGGLRTPGEGTRAEEVLRTIDTMMGSPRRSATPDRVLVIFPFLAVGGAETQMLEVLQRLRDRFEFVVATTDPLAASLGSMLGDFLRVVPHVYCLPEAIDRELLFSAVAHLIERYGIGVVLVANGSAWIYDAAPALRERFPDLRLLNQVFDHRIGWINRYDAELVRVFNHHIAPNPRIAEAYRQKGVDPSRISLVYHGVDAARFTPDAVSQERLEALRESLRVQPGRRIVTMVGRLHPQKRPQDFLALAQRFGADDVDFLLVGDGPLAAEIDAQLGRLQIPHLRRLPFHRPVIELLALSDVLVILSEYEGLPLVLLEAQSMGKPVVGTDVGAIREALDWTNGGIVVPVGDMAGAEYALRRLLQSPPEASVVRARLRERFDAEVSARGYAEALSA